MVGKTDNNLIAGLRFFEGIDNRALHVGWIGVAAISMIFVDLRDLFNRIRIGRQLIIQIYKQSAFRLLRRHSAGFLKISRLHIEVVVILRRRIFVNAHGMDPSTFTQGRGRHAYQEKTK